MSRIEDAFKRAAGVAIDESAEETHVQRQAPDPVRALEDYPAEAGPRSPTIEAPSVRPEPPVPPMTATLSEPRGAIPAGFSGKLVGSQELAPLAVEQYRRLAGTMHEIQLERGLKTLMVTSSIPHEGKTLTVSNLALTLSGAYGRRVLLIDADLRRPVVHELFGVPNARGLGDVLRTSGAELPFRQVSANLTILPAGRADQPMEALTSEAMRLLLDQCAATFDWVLLDAPPVGLMPDARLLAGLTRAVLFVIAAGSTPHTVVSRSLAEFEASSVVGTVLNRVEEHDIPSNGYYQDYYTPRTLDPTRDTSKQVD